jgi:hypothetical protein
MRDFQWIFWQMSHAAQSDEAKLLHKLPTYIFPEECCSGSSSSSSVAGSTFVLQLLPLDRCQSHVRHTTGVAGVTGVTKAGLRVDTFPILYRPPAIRHRRALSSASPSRRRYPNLRVLPANSYTWVSGPPLGVDWRRHRLDAFQSSAVQLVHDRASVVCHCPPPTSVPSSQLRVGAGLRWTVVRRSRPRHLYRCRRLYAVARRLELFCHCSAVQDSRPSDGPFFRPTSGRWWHPWSCRNWTTASRRSLVFLPTSATVSNSFSTPLPDSSMVSVCHITSASCDVVSTDWRPLGGLHIIWPHWRIAVSTAKHQPTWPLTYISLLSSTSPVVFLPARAIRESLPHNVALISSSDGTVICRMGSANYISDNAVVVRNCTKFEISCKKIDCSWAGYTNSFQPGNSLE